MPAPTNTTAATAQVLSTWGEYEIADVNLLSAPYELWFTYTTLADEYVLGVRGKAPVASTYDPIFRVYDGTVGSLNEIFAATAPNRAGDVPVQPLTQYWVKVTQATGGVPNAPLTFVSAKAPTGIVNVADLMIPDVSGGFRMAVIDPATGTVKAYVVFPAGESGTILPDGTIAMEDSVASNIKIYTDPLAAAIATVSIDLNGNGQINSNNLDAFYVFQSSSPAVITKVSNGGSILDSWTLPLNGVRGGAVSPDESIAYWIQNVGVANQPVRRYDLVNDTPLSDLAAGIASTSFARGLQVLGDGSVLVSYRPSSGDQFIRRYSAAGATLNTYTRFPLATRTVDRITLNVNDGEFWLWEQDDTTHYLTLIRASDGVELHAIQTPITVDGEIQETSDDADTFGASWSCPLLVNRKAFTVPTPGSVPTSTTEICECVPGTGNPGTTVPPGGTSSPPVITNPPPLEATIGEQLSCGGGGLVPTQDDFAPSETWWGM